MSAPTARELIVRIRYAFDKWEVVAGSEVILAARVQKALAEIQKWKASGWAGPETAAAHIERILNGEDE